MSIINFLYVCQDGKEFRKRHGFKQFEGHTPFSKSCIFIGAEVLNIRF
jgi:hypothetical protein